VNRRLLSLLLLVAACKDPAPAASSDSPHRDEEAHDQFPRQVTLDATKAAEAGIETVAVRRAVLLATLTLTGEVIAEPDKSARVSCPTSGRLEQVLFNEGSVVKRGDLLATVRVPDVGRLRGAFTAATSRARAARQNAERLAALKASGLGSEQALVDAQADARAQEAEAQALGEQLAAIGVSADSSGFLIALRAPIGGVVVARDAVVGQPINTDVVLATIVDLSEVWFLGRVFEKDLARLRVGAEAVLELNAWPREHFHGTVDYVSQQIDPLARTLTARIRVTNDTGKLRLGLFGRAYVDIGAPGKQPSGLLIPRDAVLEVAGKRVVFVKQNDGDFVWHEVVLGESAIDDVQVLSGVAEGEQVVSKGGFTLKSLLLKSTLTEEE
jgi:cobalt-zinc-cadmium efflux system membrane fusion protein